MTNALQKKYEILKKEILYQGRFSYVSYQFRHVMHNGNWSPVMRHEILERPDAVAVLPYDPILDVVVLIEQFRIGTIHKDISPWLFEIVAGVKDPNDESYESLAKREMKEESNLEVLDILHLYDYFVSPGASTEYIHLYIARVNAENAGGICGLQHENEDIFVHTIKASDAINQLHQGYFKNAPTLLSLSWLELNRDWLRKLWLKK